MPFSVIILTDTCEWFGFAESFPSMVTYRPLCLWNFFEHTEDPSYRRILSVCAKNYFSVLLCCCLLRSRVAGTMMESRNRSQLLQASVQRTLIVKVETLLLEIAFLENVSDSVQTMQYSWADRDRAKEKIEQSK